MTRTLYELFRRAVERASDRINRRYGGIVDRVRQNFVVELSTRTLRELSEDDVTHMAAGVAYYALFSIFPLLLGLISIMSFLSGAGRDTDADGRPDVELPARL